MLDYEKIFFITMNKFEKEAMDTAIYWNEEGFNKRNIKICLEFMHFPHVRLWENKFSIFNTEEDFSDGFDIQTENLKKEDWDHTVTKDIKAVHSDPTKEHLLLHQSRRKSNGEEYHSFKTLWIMTKKDNKWGIQFRSSFLEGASQISEERI